MIHGVFFYESWEAVASAQRWLTKTRKDYMHLLSIFSRKRKMGTMSESTNNNGYQQHSNDEPVVACPYCDWEGTKRGLTLHVLNKSNDDHADKYDLPDGFDADESEVVGYENVDINMPKKYDISNKPKLLCDYCGETFKGEGGLKSHLTRKAGTDEAHPQDATERDIESFTRFEVQADGTLGEPATTESPQTAQMDTGGVSADDGSIPREEVEKLYEQFIEDDEEDRSMTAYHAAERLKMLLERY